MSRGRFKLLILPSAGRKLLSIRGAVQERIRAAIRSLADDPRPPGSILMQGQAKGLHRVRVGDWRVVYRIQDTRRTVLILRIGHRSEGYSGYER